MTNTTTSIANQKSQIANSSTGPRTPEGKKRSSMNALKHGLRAQPPILPGEDPQPFLEFHRALLADLRPRSTLQTQCASRLIHAAWRLRRLDDSEAKMLKDERDRLESEVLTPWATRCTQAARARVEPPPKPAIPTRAASDVYADALQSPTPPPFPRPDLRVASTTPLQLYLRYHKSVESTYLRLAMEYRTIQAIEKSARRKKRK